MAERPSAAQARRAFLRIGSLTALAVLAGCQVVPRQRPTAPPPVAPTPPPPPVVEPGLPKDETRNRVAVLVPLSGPNAGVGRSLANAANLALLDTGGKVIRLTVYDTAVGGAQAAANQALADGNGLFLGPLLAEEVRAVAPVARGARVPVVAFSNDSGVAGNGVYVMGFAPANSVARVVDYARSQGLERFAGLIPNGDYGRRAGQALIASVEGAGGRLVAMQNYDRSPPSVRSAMTRLNQQSQFDAILIADTGQPVVLAAPLIRSGPSARARIMGTELWRTDTTLNRATALHGAWTAGASDTLFNQLRTRYRARYNVAPYRLASLGYDAALLAIRVGRDWPIGAPFPAAALTNAEGFVGVDGAFRFGRDGVAERALEVQQLGPGGFTTVSPAPKGFGR